KALGSQQLICTTNFFGDAKSITLPALTDGDIIDAHNYGREEDLTRNPRYSANLIIGLGSVQVTGKPMTVSEWNIEPFPARDRFTAPLYTASIASLQGWDAMMLYGYSQAPLNGDGNGSNYSTFNDPAIIGLMPAAALLYRQNHVLPAKNNYALSLDRNQFFFNPYNANTSKTIRTLMEISRVSVTMPNTPELPWLQENTHRNSNAMVSNIYDINRDFIPDNQQFVSSDTGELKRDWMKGIQTINTEKSQIASGWIGGEKLSLKSVNFEIQTPKATVAVQSLENQPIEVSKKIFITAMARSEPGEGNRLPFYSEPIVGHLEITAPEGLSLFAITPSGAEGDKLATHYNNGRTS
ncbi:MAG: hypothetical protein RL563_489, partial [Pseudomonadota bacterium]